jgi:hypothetical protein
MDCQLNYEKGDLLGHTDTKTLDYLELNPMAGWHVESCELSVECYGSAYKESFHEELRVIIVYPSNCVLVRAFNTFFREIIALVAYQEKQQSVFPQFKRARQARPEYPSEMGLRLVRLETIQAYSR